MKLPELFHNKLILAAIMFFASVQCFSQSMVKNFKDSTSFVAYIVNKGDSVAIQVDSTIMMNRSTFSVYKKYREKLNSENNSYAGVIAVYESIISKQDSMLVAKEGYYQELNKKFDSLSGNTKLFLSQTSNTIQTASSSLDNATVKLERTQKILEETQNLLKDERKRMNGKALKFGLGGLIIGGLIAAVIIH